MKQTNNKPTTNQQQTNHRTQGLIRKFIVLVILVLTCTNCQVDEQVLKSNEAHNGADKGEISFKQFATETGTLHFKTALAIHNNKNIYSKSINELSEFYIDTIAIRKLISKNQKATYTFRIYPLFKKNEPNEFYNLVYHKVNDSWTTSVFLLKKNLNPNIKNRPFETIEKITSQLKVPNKTQKTAAECFQFYTEIRCDGSCPGACDGLKCEKGVCYYIGIAQVSCGGGFQTSTTPINYPNTDNNNTGGGSYTDFVFNPNTLKNLDINDPNYVNLWNTVNVWTALDGTEILFFRNDAQNMIFFDATIQYQIDNNWSSESALIANSLRKAKFENPDSNFDVEASFKSPFNIDLSKVTPNIADTDAIRKQKIKFKCVYDKLIQSPKFKELFLDMFGENMRPNVTFEIANIDNNANGNTKISSDNPMNNTITIDTDLLQNGNTISIAKTIIHECIHAYLNVKLCDPSIGMSIASLSNMDVYNCINQYYNNFSAGQNQHSFIYNYMLPTLQTTLSQVKDLLVSPSNNAEMETLTMHIPYDTSPGTPWNWNVFYQNLSLSGLQDCSFFKSEIGTFDSNGVILTTIDQTKMQSYNQYNNRGRENLQKTCN